MVCTPLLLRPRIQAPANAPPREQQQAGSRLGHGCDRAALDQRTGETRLPRAQTGGRPVGAFANAMRSARSTSPSPSRSPVEPVTYSTVPNKLLGTVRPEASVSLKSRSPSLPEPAMLGL